MKNFRLFIETYDMHNISVLGDKVIERNDEESLNQFYDAIIAEVKRLRDIWLDATESLEGRYSRGLISAILIEIFYSCHYNMIGNNFRNSMFYTAKNIE